MSDLQDHDSLRSSNFDTILDYKAVDLFHNIGFARRKAPTVVIFSREARGLHRPVGVLAPRQKYELFCSLSASTLF